MATLVIGRRLLDCIKPDLCEGKDLGDDSERCIAILRKFPRERVLQILNDDLERVGSGDHSFVLVGTLAIPGTEVILIKALREFGTVKMAEDFLNSGSAELAAAARHWAKEKGYPVRPGLGSNRFTWGGE